MEKYDKHKKDKQKDDEISDSIKKMKETSSKCSDKPCAEKENIEGNKQDKNTEGKKDEYIAEITSSLQRLQAEFENYKKRIDNEKAQFMKFAKADLVLKLLPILDSFEFALNNTKDHEKFLKGIEMIYSQLHSTLESEGLVPIKAKCEKFDPFRHDVLMTEETDGPEDIVIEELQKGYLFNDRILRHSKVKISKAKSKSKKQCA